MRFSIQALVILVAAMVGLHCARKMPEVDLSQVHPSYLEECNKSGALVLLDERYEDYWARNYDNTRAITLGQMGEQTRELTLPSPVRRILLRVLNPEGAGLASTFDVAHMRERKPPVEVHVWGQDGAPRDVRVMVIASDVFVNWPCDKYFPRSTRFKISTLYPGDTVEILHPLVGPAQESWVFGSDRFCVLRSRATFGHPHETTRVDMDAVTVDYTGAVSRTSAPDERPMVYELSSPLMPLPPEQLPVVRRSFRCRGWSHLRGGLFLTAMWMSRSGSLSGAKRVPADLIAPVEVGQRLQRIRQVAEWYRQVKIEQRPVPYWMQWQPREPVSQIVHRLSGSPGGVAALVFRLFEEGGLEPRFALVHAGAPCPFMEKWVAPIQFGSLAVVVTDEKGVDHWIVPGYAFDPDRPVPEGIERSRALVMRRWIADRYQGGGECRPAMEVLYSCNNASVEPLSVDLATPGAKTQ